MLVITGDEQVFEVPDGFGDRLHSFVESMLANSESH
jgi:hypothetical protein